MSKIRFVNTVKQLFFQNNFHLSQKYVSMCTVYMHIFPHFEPEVKYSAHLVYFSLFITWFLPPIPLFFIFNFPCNLFIKTRGHPFSIEFPWSGFCWCRWFAKTSPRELGEERKDRQSQRCRRRKRRSRLWNSGSLPPVIMPECLPLLYAGGASASCWPWPQCLPLLYAGKRPVSLKSRLFLFLSQCF